MNFRLILQCCTFAGLRFSQEVGSTTIGPGEAITGGEVVRNGRQISFDVIANVRKVVKNGSSNGNKVNYEVTVRRMNCLPDPPEPEVECILFFYDQIWLKRLNFFQLFFFNNPIKDK